MTAQKGQATTCIDLKARFGDVLRIEHEESYVADRGEHVRTADPWLMMIPCQHGHICPWGGDILAACTDRRGPVAKRLTESGHTEVWMDGDDGVNVKFHVDDFEEIAAIMKPRKRRRLSPEHRQKLVEAGKANRFQGQTHGTQHAQNDPERAQAVSRDTLGVPA